jgi:hypothetical protein
VSKIEDKYQSWIGERELFASEHKNIFYPEALSGKITIIPFEEYDQLEEADDDLFYTRSSKKSNI